MYRISVTTLEKFRRYMCEASPFDTEESLLESLRGEFSGNDKTKTGHAFHKLIEGDYQLHNGLYLVEGEKGTGDFLFTPEQASAAMEYRENHRLMVHEMTISKIYQTSHFPIQVSGRVDGAEGLWIRDAKTKFRPFTVSDYLQSAQWKYYLDMLEADVFFYDVFEVRGFDQLPESRPFTLQVDVIAHPEIQCLRYDNMHYDIVELLDLFLDYVHNREVVHLLKPALPITELSF